MAEGQERDPHWTELYKLKALETVVKRLEVAMTRNFVTDTSDDNYNRVYRCLIDAIECIQVPRDGEKGSKDCQKTSDCRPGWVCIDHACEEGEIEQKNGSEDD